jgi:glycopeptide antibiotics resistance protein
MKNPVLFWLYVTGIILLVALPLNGLSADLSDITIVRIRSDYVAHFLLFVPWAFFLPQRLFWRRTWLLWGILFAAGSEMLQMALPYRAWNINDLIANSIGAVLGFGARYAWREATERIHKLHKLKSTNFHKENL